MPARAATKPRVKIGTLAERPANPQIDGMLYIAPEGVFGWDEAGGVWYSSVNQVVNTTRAALPNPDLLPIGTVVAVDDDCPFVGVVTLRPHLEADGTQRRYYRQLVNAAFSWKYTASGPVTAARLGVIDDNTSTVKEVAALADTPNCIIGQTAGAGALVLVNRLGSPTASNVEAGGIAFGAGVNVLTWDATGSLTPWTPASPTAPVGFLVLSPAFSPLAGNTSLGGSFVGYLPFIDP